MVLWTNCFFKGFIFRRSSIIGRSTWHLIMLYIFKWTAHCEIYSGENSKIVGSSYSQRLLGGINVAMVTTRAYRK